MEYRAQHPVAQRLPAEIIAVAQKEKSAVYTSFYPSVFRIYNLDAYLGLHIIEQPYIVIAGEPYNLYAGIGHACQLPEKTDVAPGHYRAVLEPVVEHIAEQINGTSIVLYAAQKRYNTILMRSGIGDIARPQVHVAKKICIPALLCHRRPSSSLASSLIMS